MCPRGSSLARHLYEGKRRRADNAPTPLMPLNSLYSRTRKVIVDER